MSVAVFIPTFYRPQNLTELILSYESTTQDEDVEIYFTVAEDDNETKTLLDQFGYRYHEDSGDIRFVKRIQYMFENTTNEWFLTGADDIIFHPRWLAAAKIYLDEYSVISFNDLCNPNLPGTNFLIWRQYIDIYSGVIDSPRTVFNQDYFHNFCDNELVETARSRNAFVQCEGVIEHMHPTINKSEWDNGYQIARDHWDDDASLYNQRRSLWG